jgi:CO dehydrogenase/acetyl-CoA synthase alpha subunit
VIIKLIPSAPEFVPIETKLGEVKKWLKLNVISEKIDYILTDEVRFIDQGENFESISCPYCSSNIDMEWWGDAMNTASNGTFRNLEVVVECCNKNSSLNELCYKWDAGFSRFSIEIMNPMNELTKESLQFLEN